MERTKKHKRPNTTQTFEDECIFKKFESWFDLKFGWFFKNGRK